MIKRDGTITKGRITKLLGYEGLKQVDIEEAVTGDIVTVAGFEDVEHRRDPGLGRDSHRRTLRLDRRADPVDELHRQHLPVCRP